MEQLVEWMSGLDGPAPALVVHIGAGSGAVVARWQAIPAGRRPASVVLVEGDPEAAESLKREAGATPWMRVLASAVAPVAGRLAWHRFSLASVNGPLDGTGLAAYYPRLRRLASIKLDAVALADLLPPLLAERGDSDAPTFLAFDVPGQEAALLRSLPDELLYRFSSVILRGCKEAPGPGGVPLASAVDALRTRLFALASADDEREPLWPMAWLRFDANARELQRLRAALAEREAQISELTKSCEGHKRTGKESESRIEALTTECKGLRTKLTQELQTLRDESGKLKLQRDEAQKCSTEFKRGLIAARTQVAMKQRRIDELEAELQQLRRSQGSLDDEIARAEGQLDLIKDLLLLTPQSHAA